MKKILLFSILFALVLGGCSSDDSTPPVPPKPILKQLELITAHTTVKVNDKVTFTVLEDGTAINDADIFSNDVKIAYEHTFTTAGEYQIIAKKANAADSKIITIVVVEHSLVLSANVSTSNINATVTFKVTKDGETVTDAEIFANDVKIDYTHAFTVAGEYSVIAKKANHTDSNILIIKVKDDQVPPGGDSKYLGKWTPTTITATISGFPVPGGNLVYPHKAGCDQDTIELKVGYMAEFILHEDNCTATTATGPWSEDGEILTMPIFGVPVEGKVKLITANTLIVEIDVNRYSNLVEQIDSELAGMILPGMKADIKFVK
ncbi:hypothetical protein [Flavobacterium sp. NKUCC04_CG]|uniref:hypothetical protein n=1 Tax=Flavobacterium sp. NKUCC04_CG TaxID=2842121 RepID=UPI001C5B361B|nr:hypothetical protein [Flavobacterium sp. NKUCC04_CG]MBW3518854.1 hypothetical protein [Flavobacterium sp. NKUCC04_CG]